MMGTQTQTEPPRSTTSADSQMAAARAIVWACWAGMALALGLSLSIGANPVVPMIASLAICAMATLGLRFGGATARMCAGLGLVGVPMVLTGVFATHPWQADTHMLFFAALAGLIALNDSRVIIVAAASIVLHHAALSVLMPALVYPSADLADALARALLHGAIVAMQVVALVAATRVRQQLDGKNEDQLAQARRLFRVAQTAREQSEKLVLVANAERDEAIRSLAATRAQQERL